MQNYVQPGDVLEVTVDSPAVPASGIPCRFGSLCGIAMLNEGEGGAAATKTMVKFGGGIYDISVTDTGGGGIAIGDQLYLHDANPPLIDDVATAGYSFGVALETLGVGATGTINVLHIPRFGLGTTPADGTVVAAKLGALAVETAAINTGAVTTAKLDEKTIKYAEVAVSNAEFKGLRAAPKTLVASPGAGKYLEFISATCFLDYGSNVLTRPNADEDLCVRLKDGTGAVVSEASAAGFPVAAADQVCTLRSAATQTLTVAQAIAVPLVLHNDGTAEFGGNAGADTLLRVKVSYRVHTSAF